MLACVTAILLQHNISATALATSGLIQSVVYKVPVDVAPYSGSGLVYWVNPQNYFFQ